MSTVNQIFSKIKKSSQEQKDFSRNFLKMYRALEENVQISDTFRAESLEKISAQARETIKASREDFDKTALELNQALAKDLKGLTVEPTNELAFMKGEAYWNLLRPALDRADDSTLPETLIKHIEAAGSDANVIKLGKIRDVLPLYLEGRGVDSFSAKTVLDALDKAQLPLASKSTQEAALVAANCKTGIPNTRAHFDVVEQIVKEPYKGGVFYDAFTGAVETIDFEEKEISGPRHKESWYR